MVKKLSQLISLICSETSNLNLAMQSLKDLILEVSQKINQRIESALEMLKDRADP